MSGELVKAAASGHIAIVARGMLPSIMTKKAKKQEFLVDFVLEKKYLPSFMLLMEQERGVFYPVKERLGVQDQRVEFLEMAWVTDLFEPDYRTVVCRDWRDLWIGHAICNYPVYAEEAERLKRESS